MTIYLDIILIENLLMNYIILFTTGLITKSHTKIIRLVMASLLGGIYAIISYINILPAFSNMFLKILLSIFMVYIAFIPENVNKILKHILIFYLVSFLFGGTAFALLYVVNPKDVFVKNGVLTGTYPMKMAFLGAILGFIVLQITFRIVKMRIDKKTMLCEIEIYFNNSKETVNAIIDTGNMLKEPITNIPVIIVEICKLINLLPKELLDNSEQIICGEFKNIDNEYITKLKVIPFTSIGKENGLLLGIKPDKIIINIEGEQIENENVIIGIYNKNLSKDSKYNALLGLDALKGRKGEFKNYEYF